MTIDIDGMILKQFEADLQGMTHREIEAELQDVTDRIDSDTAWQEALMAAQRRAGK